MCRRHAVGFLPLIPAAVCKLTYFRIYGSFF